MAAAQTDEHNHSPEWRLEDDYARVDRPGMNVPEVIGPGH